MEPVIAGSFALLALVVTGHRFGFQMLLTPDGQAYVKPRRPSPYSRRWLLPELTANLPVLAVVRYWQIFSWGGTVASAVLLYELTGSLAAVWLFVWLPAWTLTIRAPVLVDPLAMALMLGGAVCYQRGETAWCCALLFAAAQVKEPAGVFGALLCPLLVPVAWALTSTGFAVLVGRWQAYGELEEPAPDHDFLNPITMLLPWGAVALLPFLLPLAEPSFFVGVSVVLAYAQLLLATDGPRLYQWCAPAVLIWLAPHLSGPALPFLLTAHPFLCGATRKP